MATGKESDLRVEPGALTFIDSKEADEELAERDGTDLEMSKKLPGEEWELCHMLWWLSQKASQDSLKDVGYL